MSESNDFVTALHEDLGEHYQTIMMQHKGNISGDTALQVAAMLTAAQSNAAYTSLLQEEIANLRKTMIAIEKSKQGK
ncbi:MAG: hypothetical protein WBB82_05970 [Limnothrix sp.]